MIYCYSFDVFARVDVCVSVLIYGFTIQLTSGSIVTPKMTGRLHVDLASLCLALPSAHQIGIN